ncbi:zinc transporter ZIP11 isoform X5 [Ursus arctos]|uniref:zinc transporter ZIP11 isoform X5 n=1 Tax=Ursus arctos TaxID=9644 RepID=UPI002546DA4F|nr:zinc transporter ZIP11 isoform X5 [Ursus arctos]XP_057174022.1 zinc transporter ZIP11 isoform X5 [Ursus arctos]
MLQGHSSVLQALLGTFFTWGLTAAGAALVFVFSSGQRRILDGSLGFAAGVMLAASYWSLLAPAVEMATSSGGFGAFAFFPVAVGFTLGAAFVYLADLLMPHLGAAEDPPTALALNFTPASMKKSDTEGPGLLFPESELSIRIGRAGLLPDKSENGEAYQRKKAVATGLPEGPVAPVPPRGNPAQTGSGSWRRIALLILAITIHNIPEGLAVGVGFGAVEKTASATFESASSQEDEGCSDRAGMERDQWEEEVFKAEPPDGTCWLSWLSYGRKKGEFRFGQQGDTGNPVAQWKGPEGDSTPLHGLGNRSYLACAWGMCGSSLRLFILCRGSANCSPWAQA